MSKGENFARFKTWTVTANDSTRVITTISIGSINKLFDLINELEAVDTFTIPPIMIRLGLLDQINKIKYEH